MAETLSCDRLAARYERHQHDHQPQRRADRKGVGGSAERKQVFLSILALGEYDKGIYNLPEDYPNRPRFIAARDRLVARFAGRIVSVGDAVVRRWGVISGDHKRLTGVADVRASGAQIFDPWMDDPANFPLSPMSRSRH
jgi:toxin FitB